MTANDGSGGGCPFGGRGGPDGTSQASSRVTADAAAAGSSGLKASGGGCPFSGGPGGTAAAPPVVTASGEVLNPRNMMPELPQTAAPGQIAVLSKDREDSTIPKAGEAVNWVYPSPQQFYNALLRKNKDPDAEDMDAVVHVHNVTNERTWQRILDWERLHERSCASPTLVRFVGRSTDLSWGALWSKAFSYRGVPFDRHDWFVDRCGQKVVRYVIDYYDDSRSVERDDLQITIDARPAFDSFGATVDRMRRPWWQARRMWSALFGGS